MSRPGISYKRFSNPIDIAEAFIEGFDRNNINLLSKEGQIIKALVEFGIEVRDRSLDWACDNAEIDYEQEPEHDVWVDTNSINHGKFTEELEI